jgi:hypothetical protein
MTSFSLLAWIVSGIVLQLTIYLGIGFWCKWMDYQALPVRGVELDIPLFNLLNYL